MKSDSPPSASQFLPHRYPPDRQVRQGEPLRCRVRPSLPTPTLGRRLHGVGGREPHSEAPAYQRPFGCPGAPRPVRDPPRPLGFAYPSIFQSLSGIQGLGSAPLCVHGRNLLPKPILKLDDGRRRTKLAVPGEVLSHPPEDGSMFDPPPIDCAFGEWSESLLPHLSGASLVGTREPMM